MSAYRRVVEASLASSLELTSVIRWLDESEVKSRGWLLQFSKLTSPDAGAGAGAGAYLLSFELSLISKNLSLLRVACVIIQTGQSDGWL